jgi:hypothetical protein
VRRAARRAALAVATPMPRHHWRLQTALLCAATASTLLLAVRALRVYRRRQRRRLSSNKAEPLCDATGGAFTAAAALVASTGSGLDQEQQLALYGLYKQATVGHGPDSGSAPPAWDVVAVLKW